MSTTLDNRCLRAGGLFRKASQAAGLQQATAGGSANYPRLFNREPEKKAAAPTSATLAPEPALDMATTLPPLIAVASGKGGVGKTFFSVNLALAWQAQGRRAALVDMDWGLGNLDVALGLAPRRHLGTVLTGSCSVADALIDYNDLILLPNSCGDRFAPEGISASLGPLLSAVVAARPDRDLLIADTHPGLGPGTVDVIRRAAATVLISSTEPTAITDTYALLKVLSQTKLSGQVGLVINSAPSRERAEEAAMRFQDVARRFLGVEVPYWGSVLQDALVPRCICRQRPLLQEEPLSRTAMAVRQVASRVLQELEAHS